MYIDDVCSLFISSICTMVNKFNYMSKGFRIGGYGVGEPIVEDVRKGFTIKNPHRINMHYLKYNLVLKFEGTHLREEDEYVWVVYREDDSPQLGIEGTLRMIREMDERGWVELIWTWEDGNEYRHEIHKDDLQASKIQKFIENRIEDGRIK